MSRPLFVRDEKGFTLIEMLVSLVLLCLISLLLLTITGQTSRMWHYTTSRSEQFGAAGQAFDSITQRLSQATLNTYWDYDNLNKPTKYQRQSQLRFLTDRAGTLLGDSPVPGQRHPGHAIFFQAPLGFADDPANFSELDNLLNTWGYYVEFSQDIRPDPIEKMTNPLPPPLRYRYRLMELMEPSNTLTVYSSLKDPHDWFLKAFKKNNPPDPKLVNQPGTTANLPDTHIVAENVIQLVIQPRLTRADDPKNSTPLSPRYKYDSSVGTGSANDPRWANQLPPVVQVTMVALDEASAARVSRGNSIPAFDSLLQSSTFADASTYDADLLNLEVGLANQKLNYRVFTTNVSIRGARWSRY